ncbi:MAG: CDP-diacylglycerol--serine O-phosphatidyltransferase [Cyclobacteriaceae bacterium]|nr:CDP-diacylglycerol--serine O-phosphatidyltransferase [Cyclobacteriaceae bacterium]
MRHIPNLLTCFNLLCGCLGIVFVLENRNIEAAYFVWAACVFDFFDGFAARTLKVSSPIGKELDSLADVISFGLLPAVVMYKLWPADSGEYLPFVSFSIAIFSALRLAIFNVDETQRDSFRGLPTPANALLITAFPLQGGVVMDWLTLPWVLVAVIILSSFLLVSPLELFALKFKNFTWQANKIRFTFLILSVLVLAFGQAPAIPLVIILYIGLSLGVQILSK